MSGLVLGILGGSIVAGATACGAFPVFFQNSIQQSSKFKIDFFIGLLLAITAFSHFSQLVVVSFLLGLFFMSASRQFIENMVMPGIALTPVQHKAVLIMMLILLKNIPEGLAAGASMNFTHEGLGHSLLSALVLQDLIDGLTIALSLIVLGLSPLLAFIGAAGSGFIEFFAAIFGGYLSKEFTSLLPIIIAFTAGAMMSSTMEAVLKRVVFEFRKIELRPKFINGMVVMFVFIIWKELL